MLDRLRLGIECDRKVSFPVYMFYVFVVGFEGIAYLHYVQPCYHGLGMVLATLRRLY